MPWTVNTPSTDIPTELPLPEETVIAANITSERNSFEKAPRRSVLSATADNLDHLELPEEAGGRQSLHELFNLFRARRASSQLTDRIQKRSSSQTSNYYDTVLKPSAAHADGRPNPTVNVTPSTPNFVNFSVPSHRALLESAYGARSRGYSDAPPLTPVVVVPDTTTRKRSLTVEPPSTARSTSPNAQSRLRHGITAPLIPSLSTPEEESEPGHVSASEPQLPKRDIAAMLSPASTSQHMTELDRIEWEQDEREARRLAEMELGSRGGAPRRSHVPVKASQSLDELPSNGATEPRPRTQSNASSTGSDRITRTSFLEVSPAISPTTQRKPRAISQSNSLQVPAQSPKGKRSTDTSQAHAAAFNTSIEPTASPPAASESLITGAFILHAHRDDVPPLSPLRKTHSEFGLMAPRTSSPEVSELHALHTINPIRSRSDTGTQQATHTTEPLTRESNA